MNDEQVETGSAPQNDAVAAALGILDGLDEVPLHEHAAVFETVRTELRTALDAD